MIRVVEARAAKSHVTIYEGKLRMFVVLPTGYGKHSVLVFNFQRSTNASVVVLSFNSLDIDYA